MVLLCGVAGAVLKRVGKKLSEIRGTERCSRYARWL